MTIKNGGNFFCILITLCLFVTPTQGKTQPQAIKNCHNGTSLATSNINPQVLKTALKAYYCAKTAGITHKDILTIVDYTLPSTAKRLWVINVAQGKVLYNTLVSHGKGSGLNFAHIFSDKPQSYTSSLGLFITDKEYHGHYGVALRVKGLEKGFNSHAFSRDIVVHSAWYVSKDFVKKYGYLGRSFGCFALNKQVSKNIIERIKNGTLIFSYYNNPYWLAHSHFLHC